MVSRAARRSVTAFTAVVAATVLMVGTAPATAAPATAAPARPVPAASVVSASVPAASVAVGTTSLAEPSSGGRYVYVATNGTDTYKTYNRVPCLVDPSKRAPYQDACPEPTPADPLRTIEAAVKAARPGDVIVVRGGVYPEAVGWGIQRGTAVRPIVLQSAPGERVEVHGTLIMSSPDHWTIRGIRFIYNADVQRSGQSVVVLSGGDGWTFANNEVTGSLGVANVLINATTATGTTAQLQAAAPRNYRLAGNCIHDNRGSDAAGTDHNIYLMSSIYSTGGVIERNLIAGAPRGANIKAAGSTPAAASSSPRNVLVQYNTLLTASSGITIGLAAEAISAEHNIIAISANSGANDGAVKTYRLAAPGKNAVKDSLLAGYAKPLAEDYGVTQHIFMARNDVSTPFTYTGSIANCTARAASAAVLAKWGQYAG